MFGAVVICIANPPFTKCFPKQVLSIIKLFRRLAKTYLFIRKIFICRKKRFSDGLICFDYGGGRYEVFVVGIVAAGTRATDEAAIGR